MCTPVKRRVPRQHHLRRLLWESRPELAICSSTEVFTKGLQRRSNEQHSHYERKWFACGFILRASIWSICRHHEPKFMSPIRTTFYHQRKSRLLASNCWSQQSRRAQNAEQHPISTDSRHSGSWGPFLRWKNGSHLKKQLFFSSKILLSGHGSLGTFISCRLARMRCAAFNTRVVGGGSIFQYLRVWMGEGKQEDSSRQQGYSSPHSCPTAEVSCVPT